MTILLYMLALFIFCLGCGRGISLRASLFYKMNYDGSCSCKKTEKNVLPLTFNSGDEDKN